MNRRKIVSFFLWWVIIGAFVFIVVSPWGRRDIYIHSCFKEHGQVVPDDSPRGWKCEK